MDTSKNIITSGRMEACISYNQEEQLFEFIQSECNGEISGDTVDKSLLI